MRSRQTKMFKKPGFSLTQYDYCLKRHQWKPGFSHHQMLNAAILFRVFRVFAWGEKPGF
ncbi:hypothetical protein [Brunnivagina elsteri]|uniref:hypothetical protein n=1 Tax=Brunnivagina elsteri TaxID=1247191 RepID=UPI001304100B|nr:hypothetical protein [Calothrix elsteri]